MSSNKAASSREESDPHKSDPLPPGWTRQFSKSQQKYFYHHKESAVTQWHFPTASEAKNPLVAKERADQAQARELKRSNDSSNGNSNSDVNNSNNSNRNSTGNTKELTNKSNINSNSNSNSNISNKRPRVDGKTDSSHEENDASALLLADRTSVAVIVPYRDLHAAQKRAAHLKAFIPHMIAFFNQSLQKGLIADYFVYIIEQSDDGYKFNRGKLLNIGFDLARKSKRAHDVYIFHDVDLLPESDLQSWYAKFPQTPIHIARVWDRYSNNPKYFGGVVSFSSSDYKRINGYPNNFFGWGGEDDEMQRRLERLGIQFIAPNRGTLRDLEDMTITEKMDFLRQNKEWKCMVKWELKDEHEATWKTNGLVDLKYSTLSQTPLDANNRSAKFTVEVKLNGNHWTNEKAALDFVETSWKK